VVASQSRFTRRIEASRAATHVHTAEHVGIAAASARLASESRRPPERKRGFSFWLALLVLAFLWQSFVAQTHVHFERLASQNLANTQAPATNDPERSKPGDPVTHCPVCRAVAHAGVFLPSAPIALPAAAATIVVVAIAVLTSLILRLASHLWRSRAPPTNLRT